MALTKFNMWISIVGFIGIMAVLTMTFGNSLINNPDITLDDDSQEYIATYGGSVINANLTDMSEEDTAELRDDGIDTDEDAGKTSTTDILASLNFLRVAWNKIEGFFRLIFNVPTFLLTSLGLPLAAFSIVINISGYIIFIVLIILAKKFLSH